MKILEVIVTSLADAIEAEAGGADRLELVRDLAAGGYTPDFSLASEICSSVSLPIRVMVRESGWDPLLCRQAAAFGRLRIDGLVLGFLAGGQLDMASLNAILSVVPNVHATFHRAFDGVSDPTATIDTLKKVPQIDRLLTAGGGGCWAERKRRLHEWQRQAQPEIKIIAGAGIEMPVIADLMTDTVIQEIHVGRAARNPAETWGVVCREKVRKLKDLFV